MTTPTAHEEALTLATDVCALPLVRRLAAMLDRDPFVLREGDPLPHGWHVALFNAPTPQSRLRADGTADLGVPLPDIGLPRLMMGGRQLRFEQPLPIGARLRRETRRGEVQMKEGRSGRFALVKVEHRILVEGHDAPCVVERIDYVLRPASEASPAAPAATAAAPVVPEPGPRPDATRAWQPDERLLFRYSSITDNPHRIHYDLAYATQQEGYPALVVNGSLPAMFLLEMFRQQAGREPLTLATRNLAPMYCGRPLRLNVLRDEAGWRLWAEDEGGRATFDARAT